LTPDFGQSPAIPLAGWADRQLDALARSTGSAAIASLTGQGLLGERAALNGFRVPSLTSAGGGCRLYQTRDGWIALSLVRADDRALLPALFGDAAVDPANDADLAARIAVGSTGALVAHGAALGLAIAGDDEPDAGHSAIAATQVTLGGSASATRPRAPLVIDLSALWAGPLATHLLQLAGATVIKVESTNRPDSMRTGDPALFNLLNQDKASVALDLRLSDDRNALIALIRKADIVVEAARPRALLQLGIDADALVAESRGLVWLTITGHGSADRVGFGDDCGVAAGLTAAMRQASGKTGFVGDAIADPLTGIGAAKIGWSQWQSERSARIFLSMSGIAAAALAEEIAQDGKRLESDLCNWANAAGRTFPPVPTRRASAARPLGSDGPRWLQPTPPC
jgi:CoA-transferase family III